MKILMDMLLFDRRKPASQSNSTELSYRLYACQRNVIYSRPQFFDGEDFLSVAVVFCLIYSFLAIKFITSF